MSRRAAGLSLALLFAAAAPARSEQRAVYVARGADAKLFDQYDGDGYSLAVSPGADGTLTLTVTVSDAPLASAAAFPPPPSRRGPAPPPAPERDAFASRLAAGSRSQVEAVRRVLAGVAAEVAYDPDRLRRQDPAAVFSSRRAYCVGFAELAVELLARLRISARTVQGVLRVEPGSDGYEARLGGAFHRWIEVFYPDRGWVFSDPRTSVNGVDARYVAFSRRVLTRPKDLALTILSESGELSYFSTRAGDHVIRVRP